MPKTVVKSTKYNANYRRYGIKLHLQNDADIIQMIESFDVGPYVAIKQILRDYITRGGKTNEV